MFSKLPVRQRVWFYAKFLMCFAHFLVSMVQMIFIAVFRDPEPKPVTVIAEVFRTFFWGFCTSIIFLEYTSSIPTSFPVRLYWIVTFVTTTTKEYTYLVLVFRGNTNLAMFISFQFLYFMEFLLLIIGVIGFSKVNRRYWEPNIHPRILSQRRGFSQRDLWLLISPHKWKWITASFFSLLSGGIFIKIIEYICTMANIVDGCRWPATDDTQEKDKILVKLYYFIGFSTTLAITTVLSSSLFGLASASMISQVKRSLISSLLSQDMGYFTQMPTGKLSSHFLVETDKLAELRYIVPGLLFATAQIVVGVFTLITVSWQATIVVLGLFILEFLEVSIRFRHVTIPFKEKYTSSIRKAAERTVEILSSISTVKEFRQQDKEKFSLVKKQDSVSAVLVTYGWLESIFDGIRTVIHCFIVGIGIYFSFTLVYATQNHFQLDTSGFTEFLVVSIFLYKAFLDVLTHMKQLSRAGVPASIIMAIIKRKPTVLPEAGHQIVKFSGKVELSNVTFKSEAKDRWIFRDLSVTIPAQSSCAFIDIDDLFYNYRPHLTDYYNNDNNNNNNNSSNISNRSSGSIFRDGVVSCFLRFADASKGTIMLDDEHDIRDLNHSYLMSTIGVLSPEPVIFKGTLRDNILYGIPTEILENISAAQIESRLHEVVQKSNLLKIVTESGLDFVIDERGGNLTLPEQHCVAIARLFMKNPQVLLLDQPIPIGAQWDSAWTQVFNGIKELSRGRTTIAVTSNLHLLTDVNMIYILKDGKIVDKGTHTDFISRPSNPNGSGNNNNNNNSSNNNNNTNRNRNNSIGNNIHVVGIQGLYKTIWDHQQSHVEVAQILSTISSTPAIPQTPRSSVSSRRLSLSLQPNIATSKQQQHTQHNRKFSGISSDTIMLLDVLDTHSDQLQEIFPDVHSILRQIRPHKIVYDAPFRLPFLQQPATDSLLFNDNNNNPMEMRNYVDFSGAESSTFSSEKLPLLSTDGYNEDSDHDESDH